VPSQGPWTHRPGGRQAPGATARRTGLLLARGGRGARRRPAPRAFEADPQRAGARSAACRGRAGRGAGESCRIRRPAARRAAALRWRDVDFAGHALTVGRAMSAGVESSTKSGGVRRVPLPDQAAAALDRLSRREDFTGPDERVFCNALGRTLDGSALRRRFKRARDAAGLRRCACMTCATPTAHCSPLPAWTS
jgi:integrase